MDTLEVIKQYEQETGLFITEVKLAKALGVCRDTARTRVQELIDAGKLEYEYRPQQGHFKFPN